MPIALWIARRQFLQREYGFSAGCCQKKGGQVENRKVNDTNDKSCH
jgi:hypothetical protein